MYVQQMAQKQRRLEIEALIIEIELMKLKHKEEFGDEQK